MGSLALKRPVGVQAGGDQYDRSVAMVKANSYCEGFGFHVRTVQRWAERLLDAEQ